MNRKLWRAAAILYIAGACGFCAVRWANDSGNPYRRTDFADIHFKLNSASVQTIVAGDPVVAAQGGLDAWNSVAYSAVHFAPLEITTAGISSTDQQHVISVASSAAALSAVGSALAVTILASSGDGRITDSDIVLNPAARFSTTLQPGSYDLQAVITHELGHALGANHATVAAATMFYNTPLQDRSKEQLKPDDASFAVDVYPGNGAISAYGLITGTASKDGVPLAGAALVATDPSTGVTIGGLSSLSDGSFALRVPAGNYLVFAAPLTGTITPSRLYAVPGGSLAKADIAFKAAVAGGPDSPSLVRIEGGATANAAVSTVGGISALDIVNAGKIVTTNGVSSFSIAAPPAVAQAGQALDFILSGPGLDASIAEGNIRLIGQGVTLRPGTLVVESRIKDTDGRSPLRFTIDIAPRSSAASVSIFIVRGGDTAFSAGSLLVLPPKPVFTASSLVDAGSFKGAGVSPGELISLFGASIGPETAVVNNGFDPASGALRTSLGGLSVTFDGIPAPLVFVSNLQVNLQVPYEIAGHASTAVVVQNQGVASDPVTVPVVAAQPGIFLQAGSSQSIALNQDGSVNSSSHPAPKGSVITLFATGAGLVNPPVATGKPAPGTPLSTANGVGVSVGGLNARVLFGGLAPGFVGLMQVNLEIPQGAPSGSVPIQLIASGQTSPAGSIVAIQ